MYVLDNAFEIASENKITRALSYKLAPLFVNESINQSIIKRVRSDPMIPNRIESNRINNCGFALSTPTSYRTVLLPDLSLLPNNLGRSVVKGIISKQTNTEFYTKSSLTHAFI